MPLDEDYVESPLLFQGQAMGKRSVGQGVRGFAGAAQSDCHDTREAGGMTDDNVSSH